MDLLYYSFRCVEWITNFTNNLHPTFPYRCIYGIINAILNIHTK